MVNKVRPKELVNCDLSNINGIALKIVTIKSTRNDLNEQWFQCNSSKQTIKIKQTYLGIMTNRDMM